MESISTYDPDVDSLDEQELPVQAWRREQLRGLGVPRVLADCYAELADWHEVEALVECGCPPELALEIAR